VDVRGGFYDAWRVQLQGCARETHKLAVDALAFYLLPISRPTTARAKRRRLDEVVGWHLAADRPNLGLLEAPFTEDTDHGTAGRMPGLMNPGQFYLTEIPYQIAFYLDFARLVHENRANVMNVDTCKSLADAVRRQSIWGQQKNCNAARHILMHLLFPDLFERMSSEDHKRMIIEAFSGLSDGSPDPDDSILSIRRNLEAGEYAGKWVDFYGRPEIRRRWRGDGEASEEETADEDRDDMLPRIADLLEQRKLNEPEVLQQGWWRENIRPISRPFLEKIAAHLEGYRTGFSSKSKAGRKRSDYDRLHVALSDQSVPWGYDGSHAIVTIGYADRPDNDPNLEQCLVWGIDGWMPKTAIDDAAERARQILGSGFSVRVEDASETSGWAGKYVVGFKALDPSQLRERQSNELATEIAEDLRRIIESAGGPRPPSSDGEPNRLQALVDETFLSVQELTEVEQLLADKKQIILEGPPGSGKTFVAEKFARYFTQNELDNNSNNGRLEIVQFHQSYGYEDFVQGIRPNTENGVISYEVKSGIFSRFCDRARRDPDGKPHVIIIDEINRGNVARIFGELLLALEYRDKEVRLPYAEEDDPPFAIPDNVYVVGTMNTTDRSLALLDYALRRRFYFYRLLPMVDSDAPVLRGWLDNNSIPDSDRILRLFIRLNQEVQIALGPQGMHFQVGHSYFMNERIGEGEVLERIWRRAILPLLEEYFYPARNAAQLSEEFSIERLLGAGSSGLELTAERPDVS
jgi:MoxR-like ATPase